MPGWFEPQGQGECRDIVFVPIGLNYDRIPEDKTLLAHQQQGFRNKGRFYASLSFLRFAVLMAPRMIGLSKPFGRVVANFGGPVSLADWQQGVGADLETLGQESRREAVKALGEALSGRIQALIPVLPVSLLSQVLRTAYGAEGTSELQLKSDAMKLAAALDEAGVAVSLDADTADREFSEALYMLLKRAHVVYDARQRLQATAEGEAMLDYNRRVIPPGFCDFGKDTQT